MDNRTDTKGLEMYSEVYRNAKKRPKYCTKCRAELIEKAMRNGYNAFSGEEDMTDYLLCPKLQWDHDRYELIDGDDPYEIPQFDFQTLVGTLSAQKG